MARIVSVEEQRLLNAASNRWARAVELLAECGWLPRDFKFYVDLWRGHTKRGMSQIEAYDMITALATAEQERRELEARVDDAATEYNSIMEASDGRG